MGKKQDELLAKLNKLEKDNRILMEKEYRNAAQIARSHVPNSFAVDLRKAIKDIYFANFSETAISLLQWEKLPETPFNTLTSKQLEKQIYTYPAVTAFKHNVSIAGGNYNSWLALPFTGAYSINVYMDFPIIKPYSPSTDIAQFRDLKVNQDCVVMSDFFFNQPTNANTSMCMKTITDIFTSLMADCEVAKYKNRNYIKMPPLFESGESMSTAERAALNMEIHQFIEGVESNDSAISSYVFKYLKNVDFTRQYFGKELQGDKRDYERDLLGFYGVPHLQAEKGERMNVPEVEKNFDEFNINLEKRLQNRQQALDTLKNLFPEWAQTQITVNMQAYNAMKQRYNELGSSVEDFAGEVSENDAKRS